MRWLIDGYNVMHVAGVIDSKMSRERFRKARKRFLDHLASKLGDLAGETAIVFDANKPPADFPVESNYRGISTLLAKHHRRGGDVGREMFRGLKL